MKIISDLPARVQSLPCHRWSHNQRWMEPVSLRVHPTTSRLTFHLCPRRTKGTVRQRDTRIVTLRFTCPRAWTMNVWKLSNRALVTGETWILDGWPLDSIREATLTVSPKRQYLNEARPMTASQQQSSIGFTVAFSSPRLQPRRDLWKSESKDTVTMSIACRVELIPEWIPIRIFSCSSGRCRIRKWLTVSRSVRAIRQISRACRSPFRVGKPLTTM